MKKTLGQLLLLAQHKWLALISIAKNYWQHAHGAEKTFIILTSIFGLIFTFLTPPLQVADEKAHFYRAYQVSEMGLMPDIENNRSGGHLPTSLINMSNNVGKDLPFHPTVKFDINDMRGYVWQPLNSSERQMVAFESTSIYSPISYIPQSLGIAAARFAQLSPLLMMYVGRLVNLFAWLVLTTIAIKVIPIGKWALFAITITPMMIFQAASLSADTFGISIILLFIALTLQYALKTKSVRSKDLWILTILSIILGLCKMPSFLIPLILFIIPASSFSSQKKRILHISLIFLVGLAFSLLWYQLSSQSNALYTLNTVVKTNPNAQLINLLLHPIGYANVLYQTFIHRTDAWVIQYAGFLGWLDTSLSYVGIVGSYILIALGILYVDQKSSTLALHRYQRYFSLGLFFLCSISIITLLYVAWTPFKAGIIEGVQGRYFIPYSALLIPAISLSSIKLIGKPESFSKCMRIGASSILILALLYTANRYYGTIDYWVNTIFIPF